MDEKDRLIDVGIPKNVDEALKVTRSLVYWLEHIKANPHQVQDAMGSFGGHIELHLAALDAWFSYEKVNANVRSLANLFKCEG